MMRVRSPSTSAVLLAVGVAVLFLCSLMSTASARTQTSTASAQTCVQPAKGLVGWWPGDGNANNVVGANDGALQGGATFAPGLVGQAFRFDSIDDFVSGATTVGLPLGSSPRTIAAWIKADSVGPMDSIIFHYGVGDGAFPPTNFHLAMISDGRAIIGNGFGYGVAFGTTVLGDHRFHFLTGVYEGPSTDLARIYVDGVEEGTAVISTPDTPDGSFTIGQELPTAHLLPFDGLIDEVDIYDRALSASEIRAIFDAGGAGKCKPNPMVEFATMDAAATLLVPPGMANDSVAMKATFKLGPSSNGIDPATEAVQIKIDGLSLTLPAGAMAKTLEGWRYRGDVGGVPWTVTIQRLLGSRFLLTAAAARLDLKRPTGTIGIYVAVGDDQGSTTVTPLVLPRPRKYKITDLGTLGSNYSEAWGINASGQIFGVSITAAGDTHGFVWRKGIISDLGTLGGILSYPTAMNDRGQIVGYTDTGGFIWEKGVMTLLAGRDGRSGAPFGLNERGQIVGYGDNAKGETHAFLFEKGVMTDLGAFGGNYSRADAINERGQVIGNSFTAEGTNHAFVWEKGKLTDLGTLGGDTAYPTGINDRGQIAGWSFTTGNYAARAYLWENGKMTDLGALAYNYSISGGINDRGQIVGWSYTPDAAIHGFLWEHGVMTDLGTLGGRDSRAEQINNPGVIIGTDVNEQGDTHAFAWEKGAMTDLGTLGGTYSRPNGINEEGQIVGTSTTASGETHAALWIPLP